MAEPVRWSVLEATLERVTFANPDTGYTVARVDSGRGGELVTVVGAALLLGQSDIFTAPGYDGWPLVMLRLAMVDAITDSDHCWWGRGCC